MVFCITEMTDYFAFPILFYDVTYLLFTKTDQDLLNLVCRTVTGVAYINPISGLHVEFRQQLLHYLLWCISFINQCGKRSRFLQRGFYHTYLLIGNKGKQLNDKPSCCLAGKVPVD